ncbi:MAG: hypothetical protein QF440_04300 [Candidatus Thalassarchaeaceae archaeon]|jgi:hypothetical protein|nr:hypothetical protein [Candidatus Thalassarchaeaceae archaeon]
MDAIVDTKITKIVADGDLDGLLSAAILHRIWPDATIHFTHPAEVRSGGVDNHIGRETAMVDLPFHPNCGLHIDHHLTNKPTYEQEQIAAEQGCKIIWNDALSAARVCFDTFRKHVDISDFEMWMPMVDKLDGGKISATEFLSDNPIMWIGRTIDTTDLPYCRLLLEQLALGHSPKEIIEIEEVGAKVSEARINFENLRKTLSDHLYIVDRLAIVRLEEKGFRTNGYLVTAHAGKSCDACMIIHGYTDGEISDKSKWPLSASFYSNSFLHKQSPIFDLTRLATAFDVDGGGHAGACGCRIQPLSESGTIENRPITSSDIERNINAWQRLWSQRKSR